MSAVPKKSFTEERRARTWSARTGGAPFMRPVLQYRASCPWFCACWYGWRPYYRVGAAVFGGLHRDHGRAKPEVRPVCLEYTSEERLHAARPDQHRMYDGAVPVWWRCRWASSPPSTWWNTPNGATSWWGWCASPPRPCPASPPLCTACLATCSSASAGLELFHDWRRVDHGHYDSAPDYAHHRGGADERAGLLPGGRLRPGGRAGFARCSGHFTSGHAGHLSGVIWALAGSWARAPP